MDELRYALIGCGRISANHIVAAKKQKLKILAVCDTELNNAKKLISQYDLDAVKVYTNYKLMLEEIKLDLVAIATESGKHATIALDCISAGTNLIIEKPLALSMADANAIIKQAAIQGVKVSVCHQNRFNKSVQKLRNAIEQGRFGRLYSASANIRWNRGLSYYAQAPWRGTWEQDGGALMNQCIHNIDLLRWMMGGNIDEVYALTKNYNHPYIEAEDLGMAIIKFSNEALGLLEGTTNIYPSNLEETLYVFGEKGTVKLGGKSVNIIEEWRFGDGIDFEDDVKVIYSENPPNVYGYGHTPLYKDVVTAIINNKQPYITAVDGKNALELVLAIYKSAADEKPVKLPIQACSTTDFVGRFDRL